MGDVQSYRITCMCGRYMSSYGTSGTNYTTALDPYSTFKVHSGTIKIEYELPIKKRNKILNLI